MCILHLKWFINDVWWLMIIFVCMCVCVCVCMFVFTGHFRNLLVRLPGRQAGVYSIENNMSLSDETRPETFRPRLDQVDTTLNVSFLCFVLNNWYTVCSCHNFTDTVLARVSERRWLLLTFTLICFFEITFRWG